MIGVPLRKVAISLPILVVLACGAGAKDTRSPIPTASQTTDRPAETVPALTSPDASSTDNTQASPASPYQQEQPQEFRDESLSDYTRFVALDFPVLLKPEAAGFFSDDELVLGLELNGLARAYPLRMTP